MYFYLSFFTFFSWVTHGYGFGLFENLLGWELDWTGLDSEGLLDQWTNVSTCRAECQKPSLDIRVACLVDD